MTDKVRQEHGDEKDSNKQYSANEILSYILKTLVNLKKFDQEAGPAGSGGDNATSAFRPPPSSPSMVGQIDSTTVLDLNQ